MTPADSSIGARVTAAEPRAARFRDMKDWFASSFRLVVRKPGYWVPFTILLYASVVPLGFVPVAGNYLRGFLGTLWGAFAIALAYTQAGEGRISVSRSFSLLARSLPALVVLSLVQVALIALAELPVLRLIATDREFEVYALSRLQNGPARFGVDLAHTTIVVLASSLMGFATPLVVLSGRSVREALRKSVAAFARAPMVYVTFGLLGWVLPHALATTLGIPGILVFLAVVILLGPVEYLVYRSVFPEGYSDATSGSGRRRSM
jgi:hypothetical protein